MEPSHEAFSGERKTAASSPLGRLTRVLLLPEQYTPGMDALAKLRQLNTVEINETVESKTNGVAYVIDVYLTPHSMNRIPTNREHKQTLKPLVHSSPQKTITSSTTPVQNFNMIDQIAERQQPDLRVERTLDEFIELRMNLHRQAQAIHLNGANDKLCPYCTKVINYILSGESQPSPAMQWLGSEKKNKKNLTKFITKVLALALLCRPIAFPNCPSQERIPELVGKFLLDNRM